MEKFNNGNSISLETISEEELEQAFKEFSEGNEHLEKLLKECHNMGVATIGSHAGPTGHHKGQRVIGPYVEFDVKNSSGKIKNILNTVKGEDGFKILYYPDANLNFFAKIDKDVLDFDSPTFSISYPNEEKEDRINSLFDKMTDSLKEKEIDLSGPLSDLLDVFSKFTGKVSGVKFELHFNQGTYQFWIVIDQGINNPNAEYLKSIFSNTGMIFDDSEIAKENKTKAYLYELNCEDIETLGKVISNVKEAVKDLQIELPSFESEEAKKLKDGYRAGILKRELMDKYGDSEKTREGIEEYLWSKDLWHLVKFHETKGKDNMLTDEEYEKEKSKLFTKYKRMSRRGNFKEMIAEAEKKFIAEYNEILRDDYEQKQVKDSIKEKVKQIQELEEKSNEIDSQNIQSTKDIN